MARATIIVALGLMLSGCAALSLFKSHKDEPGASEPYPKLGSVPERPETTESEEARRKIAEGLVADRARVQYTDEALRGGTEASAAPPPPPISDQAPASAPAESTGATKAADEDLTEGRPGFFGRLFGSKKGAERGAIGEAGPSTPEAMPAEPATEPAQEGVAESTGATEARPEVEREDRRGLFRRLFGSKETDAAPQAEPQSAP